VFILISIPTTGAAEIAGFACDLEGDPLFTGKIDPTVGVLEHLIGHRQIAVPGRPVSALVPTAGFTPAGRVDEGFQGPQPHVDQYKNDEKSYHSG
jgi:hypothetical protein